MNTSIMIVTFSKDFSYLKHCFRSIAKFASGFHRLHVLVPTSEGDYVNKMLEFNRLNMKAIVNEYEEWPGKGMLHHQAQIMKADQWCSDADYVAHIDADCIFTEPVTPDDYIVDGKPILRYEPYSSLGVRHPGAGVWQGVVQDCLPFPVDKELMRTHPGVHHKATYPKTREVMEQHTKREFDEYMRSGINEFPQNRCEFNTLGSVAAYYFPDRYNLVRQYGDRVTPDPKLQQFWSHSPPHINQRIWVGGSEQDVVPLQMINSILGNE